MRNRSRISRAGIALAVLGSLLAGCGATAVSSAAPDPGATQVSTPAVTPVGGGWDPGPSVVPGDAEAALLHGMRLDLQGACDPLRDELPAGAAGAVTCAPPSDAAARATVVLFDTRTALMDAYQARLDAEGIPPNATGECQPGQPSEGAYVPGPGVEERGACWLGADGIAHYVATVPPFILLGVDGRPGAAGSAVWRFAWLGNQDQPGGPTLWAEEPRSPEK